MAADNITTAAEDVQKLAAQVGGAFEERAGADARSLFRPLVSLLAEGRPVPPAALAAATGRSVDAVAQAMEAFGAEFDEEGRIVGAGLTLVPTPHRFEVDGRRLYTWCALDTLFFPVLLGRPARVESTCPATGAPVRLAATPSGVEEVQPAAAVVSLIAPQDSREVRHAFCDYVHFFAAPAAAAAWLAEHPDAVVVPVRAAFEVARLVAEEYVL